MRAMLREISKVAEELWSNGEIEDYKFSHDRKHYRLDFKFRGKWLSVPFASSPRTGCEAVFTRQNIRRRIRQVS